MDLPPATRLENAQWLRHAAPATVIQTLDAAGFTTRAVGGCVRDALLQRPIGDIDLATDAHPETVQRVLSEANIKVVPTGIAHGTVTAVIKGLGVEVTTLRHDVETYGRHAKVAFTDDWRADAMRRDFTMNALYADLNGDVYDPVDGLEDLKAGRVRFIGDARERIGEDALRILRYFRFLAWFGTAGPDEEALDACTARRDDLSILSAERISTEIIKLLSAPDPMPAISAMDSAGITERLCEKPLQSERLAPLAALEQRLGEGDPIRRLAVWLSAGTAYMKHCSQRLRLSVRQQERLVKLAQPLPDLPMPMGEDAVRRCLYRMGRETLLDVALLTMAADESLDFPIDDIKHLPVPELPVQGRDVLALGVPAGPRVGAIIKAFEDWWMTQDFPSDAAKIQTKLQELASG